MQPGTPVDLEYTKRYGALVAQHSIQDFYDLLVELITNPDDSYHGLFLDGKSSVDGGQIVIEIEPHRLDRASIVTVRDRAAGFTDLRRNSSASASGRVARAIEASWREDSRTAPHSVT